MATQDVESWLRLETWANLLQAPEAALRLLLSILLGFPVAFIHRYTLYGKNPVHQHIFFVLCGFLIGLWNYGFTIFNCITASCVTYLVLKILGGTGMSVSITFVFNMTYLLYGYYTTSTGEYDIKWTMPQCVLVLRLIGLAFNLWDGQQADGKLSESQKQVALKEMPSMLEVAAFTLFPGSFLIGPQFSMKRYLDYVHGKLIERDSNTSGKQLPNCVIPGFTRAALGLFYILLYKIGSMYVSDQYLLEPAFREQNFLKRCFMVGLFGRVNLYKYICCWLITEGVCITFGLTYNGKDSQGKTKWDGCENVKLLTFENATQFNHYILSFNINTNQWCAEYIYKRLKFLGSKMYSQLFTLLFLAVWHGFHSGYYVTFFNEFIVMYFEKDIGTVLQKNEKLQSILRNRLEVRLLLWFILKIYTFVFMGYCIAPFVYLSYTRYFQFYSNVHYIGHVFFLSYPLFAPYIKPLIYKSSSRQHQE